MFKVRCCHPKIIINPALPHRIKEVEFCSFLGVTKHLDIDQRNDIIYGKNALKVFHVKAPQTCYADDELQFNYASQFFFVTYYGEQIDFFQQVACGHCEVCRESYISSIRQRIMMQLQQVKEVPLFVTFTYKPEKQPLHGADVRMLQLLKKRLKATLKNYFNVDPTLIKFLITSEVGNGGNLHYHMLVLGMPRLAPEDSMNQFLRYHLFQYVYRQPQYLPGRRNPISFDEYRVRYPLIFKRPRDYDEFSYGYVNVQEVKSSSSCVNYVTKYVTKGCSYKNPRLLVGWDPVLKRKYKYKPKLKEDGTRKDICIISQGLGIDFVRSLPIRPDGSVQFRNWMDNKLHVVFLCKYYIDYLFPSFSKLVPVAVRRAFDHAIADIARLITSKYITPSIQMSLLNTSIYLRNNWPYMVDDLFDNSDKMDCVDDHEFNCILSNIAQNASLCYSFIVNIDFSKIRDQVLARDRFLSKLTRSDGSVDVVAYRSYLDHEHKKILSHSKI